MMHKGLVYLIAFLLAPGIAYAATGRTATEVPDVIKLGDRLEVVFYRGSPGQSGLRFESVVEFDGNIRNLLYVPFIKAAGLTTNELAEELQSQLAPKFSRALFVEVHRMDVDRYLVRRGTSVFNPRTLDQWLREMSPFPKVRLQYLGDHFLPGELNPDGTRKSIKP